MVLELAKVVQQVNEMGRVLADRAGRERKALPAARALLHAFARDWERLREIAASDDGQRLRCASPDDEPLDAAFPAPPLADRVTLIAADGSQIYPDWHGLAFYFALNVGSIVFRHGSEQPPTSDSEPKLYYTEDQVYPGGDPVSSDLVGALRGLAEMHCLVDTILAEEGAALPRLGLADGPLLIWLERAAVPAAEQERILTEYLGCLDRLRAEAVPVAGFVSRPSSAEVVSLLYLSHLEAEERKTVRGLQDTPYRGLSDRALFGMLGEGQRSALFVRGTAENRRYRDKGQSIHFFYLNTGADVARVEVPEWVVQRAEALDLVHAAVYDQCRFNRGYPYVLTRADEQAVISGEEREILEAMIVQAMARHGLDWPELSRKAQQKRVARWRRR